MAATPVTNNSKHGRGSRARRRLCIALMLCAGLTIGLGSFGWWHSRVPTPLGTLPAAPSEVNRLVVELLTQAAQDEARLRQRSPGGHPSFSALAPQSLLDRYYLVQYAREKLISRGSAVIDALMNVVLDPNRPSWMRAEAVLVLGHFDDVRIAGAFAGGLERQLIEPWTLLRVCEGVYLPGNPWAGEKLRAGPHVSASELKTWIADTVQVDYDNARLRLLDAIMLESPQLIERQQFYATIRWLNRMYDVDLDEWLAQVAPNVAEFRQRQLRLGYDPALVFKRLLGDRFREEAIGAAFPAQQDRENCAALLEMLYGHAFASGSPQSSGARLLPSPGWRARLIDWYRENRSALRYNTELHRFEVQIEATETGPTEPHE